MTVPNTTYRVLVEKLGAQDPSQFVGNEGEVFYDPNNPALKLSDGTTAGGVSIGGTGGGGGEESYWVQTSAGIHTLSNVGIGTTNPTSALTVGGDVSISGVVTATTFVGDIETASLRTSELGIVLGGNSEVDVYGVSIGYNSQADTYGVSVGAFSGTKHVTNNTAYTVAIGAFAQQNANPGDSTGIGAVAIGNLAGDSKQGSDAIALGRYAGRNNQASNSIVINATGSDLDNTTSSSFVVKPIRNVTGSNILTYNSTSGEITHTTSVNINKLTFPDTTEQTTAYTGISTGINSLVESELSVDSFRYRISNTGQPQVLSSDIERGLVWSTVDSSNTVITGGSSGGGLAIVGITTWVGLTTTTLTTWGDSSVAHIVEPSTSSGYKVTFVLSVASGGNRGGIHVEKLF
jgi:hypothetical protein